MLNCKRWALAQATGHPTPEVAATRTLFLQRASHGKGGDASPNGLLTTASIIKGISGDSSCAALASMLAIPLFAGDSSSQPVFLPTIPGAGAVLPGDAHATQQQLESRALDTRDSTDDTAPAAAPSISAAGAPAASASADEAAASEYTEESFEDSYGDDGDDFEEAQPQQDRPAGSSGGVGAAEGSPGAGTSGDAGRDEADEEDDGVAHCTPAAQPVSAPLVQSMQLDKEGFPQTAPGGMSLLELLQGGLLLASNAQEVARRHALAVAATALGDLAAPHNPAAAAELERNAHSLAAGLSGGGSESILLDMQSGQLPAAPVADSGEGNASHGVTVVKRAAEARATIMRQATAGVVLLSLPGPVPDSAGPLKDLAAVVPDKFNKHQEQEQTGARFTVPPAENTPHTPTLVDGVFPLVVPGSIQNAVVPSDIVLLAQQVDPTLVPDADALLLLTRMARLVLLAVCAGSVDVAFTGVLRGISIGGNTMLARRRAMAVTANGSTPPCIPVHEGSVRSLLEYWCGSTHFTAEMRSTALRVTSGDAANARAMYVRLAERLEAHAAAVATARLMREHASNAPKEPERQVQYDDQAEVGHGDGGAAHSDPSPIQLRVSLDALVGLQSHLSRCLMSCMGLQEQHEVLHLTCVRACLLQGGGMAPTERVHRLACRNVTAPLKSLLHAACKELSVDREDCIVLWQEGSCRVVLDVQSAADLGMHWQRGQCTLWMLPLRYLELQTVPTLAHARYAAEVFRGMRWNTNAAAKSGAEVTSCMLRGVYPVESGHPLLGPLAEATDAAPGSPPRHNHSRSTVGSDMQAVARQIFPPIDVSASAAQQLGKEAEATLQWAATLIGAKRDAVLALLQQRLPLSVQQAAVAQAKAGSLRITRTADVSSRDASLASSSLQSAPGGRISALSVEQGDGEVDMPKLGPSLADIACFVQSAPVQLALVAANMAHISAAMDSQQVQMRVLYDMDSQDGAAVADAQAALESALQAAGEAATQGEGDGHPSTPPSTARAAEADTAAGGGDDEYGDESYEEDGYGDSDEFEDSKSSQATEPASATERVSEGKRTATPPQDKRQWPYLREAPAMPKALLAESSSRRVSNAGGSTGHGVEGLEASAIRHAQAQNAAVHAARVACRQAALEITMRRLGVLRQTLGILTLQFDHFQVYDTRRVLGEGGLDVHAHQNLDPALRRRALKSAQRSRSRGGSPARGGRRTEPRETSHSTSALGALMHASVVAEGASGPWASLADADSIGGPNARQLSLSEQQSAEDALHASPQEAIMSGVASVLKLRARRARERLAASRAVQGTANPGTVLTAAKRQQALAARPVKAAGDVSVPAIASQHLALPSAEQGFISPYRKGQISSSKGTSSRRRSNSPRSSAHGASSASDITDSFVSPVYSVPQGDLLQPQALTQVSAGGAFKPKRPKGRRKVPKSVKSDSGDTIKVPRHLQRRLRSMSPRDRTHALQQHKMAETARSRQAANVRTALETKAIEIQVQQALKDEAEYKRSKRMGELLSSGHGEGALLYSPFRVGVDPALIRALAAEKGYSQDVQEAVVEQSLLPAGPRSSTEEDTHASAANGTAAEPTADSKIDEGESKASESKSVAASADKPVLSKGGAGGGRRARSPRLPSRGAPLATSKVGLLGMGSALSSSAEASMQARSDARYDVAGAIQRQAQRTDRVTPLVYSIVLPPAPMPPGKCTFGSGHFEATPGEMYVYGADPLLTSLEPVQHSKSARGQLQGGSAAVHSASAPIANSARGSRAPAHARAAAAQDVEAGARKSTGLLPAAPGSVPAWDSSPPGKRSADSPAVGAEGVPLSQLMETAEQAEAGRGGGMTDASVTAAGATKPPLNKGRKKRKKKKDVFSRLYRDASKREQDLQLARSSSAAGSGGDLWTTSGSVGLLHTAEEPGVGSDQYLRRMHDDYATGAPDKFATVALTGGVRSMAQLRASSGPLSAAGAAALYNFNRHNSTALMSSTSGKTAGELFDDSQLDMSVLRPAAGVNGRNSTADIGQSAGSRAVMVTAKERFNVASSVYQSRYPDPKYPNNPYQSTKGGKAGIEIDWQRNLAPARRDAERRAAEKQAAADTKEKKQSPRKTTKPRSAKAAVEPVAVASAPPAGAGAAPSAREPSHEEHTGVVADAGGHDTAKGEDDGQDSIKVPLVSMLSSSASRDSVADGSLTMSAASTLSAQGHSRSAASLPTHTKADTQQEDAITASASLGGSASSTSLSALDTVLGTFTVQMDMHVAATDAAKHGSKLPAGSQMELFYDHFRLSPPCALDGGKASTRHTWHQLVHIGGNEARTLLKLPIELRLYLDGDSSGDSAPPAGSFAMDLLEAMWAGSAVDGSREEKDVSVSTTLHKMLGKEHTYTNADVALSVHWKPAL